MSRLRLGLIPIVSVACIVVAVLWWWHLPPGPPRPADLGALDPLVEDLVVEAIAAVRAQPRSAPRRRELGMVYEANGLEALAATCYRQLVEMDETDARAWYRLAVVGEASGDRAIALAALERVIELADYAPARWRLGFLRLQSGDLDGAEAIFQRSAERDPGAGAPRLGLARVRLEQARHAEALELVDEILAADPGHGHARLLRAAALRGLGRLDEVAAALGATSETGERFDDPWAQEAQRFRTGFNSRLRDAERHLAAGRPGEAVALLESLRHRLPDRVPLLNNLALAYVTAGRPAQALEVARAGLALEPESPALLVSMSMAFERLGDLDGALAAATRAVRAGPTYGPAHKQRGLLLGRQRRYEEALEAFAEATRYMADDEESAVRLGHVQGNLHRWAEAAATFERACARFGASTDAHVGLAVARTALGEDDAARRAWARARALGARLEDQPPLVRARLERVLETGEQPQ